MLSSLRVLIKVVIPCLCVVVTVHLLHHILRTLHAKFRLRFIGWDELEDDDEELRVRLSVFKDISE